MVFRYYQKYSTNIGKNGNVLKKYSVKDGKAIIKECYDAIMNMNLKDLNNKLKMAAQKSTWGI